MFKVIRISILVFILVFVALDAWLSHVRSTDWDNSLRVTVYPINGDNASRTQQFMESLSTEDFSAVDAFFSRETERYGLSVDEPVRVTLGPVINEQPPRLAKNPSILSVMFWSLKMRWWASRITSGLDDIRPDIKMFVRYHEPTGQLALENSIGVKRGMFGIVNAYTGRSNKQRNNVVIAHELLHTIGATDKYDPTTNQPAVPIGLADPDKNPLYPQRFAEIMGGRIAMSPTNAVIPDSLKYVVIGLDTASEIGLRD